MALFISSSTHKVDKKGRVSVPATFRAALADESYLGVVLMPSLREAPCYEGCGYARLEEIAASLDELNPLSEEYDALADAVLGRARPAPFDSEGRIILPAEVIARAQIKDQALFVGRGRSFQIWNPDLYGVDEGKRTMLAQKNIDKLPWGRAKGPRA